MWLRWNHNVIKENAESKRIYVKNEKYIDRICFQDLLFSLVEASVDRAELKRYRTEVVSSFELHCQQIKTIDYLFQANLDTKVEGEEH